MPKRREREIGKINMGVSVNTERLMRQITEMAQRMGLPTVKRVDVDKRVDRATTDILIRYQGGLAQAVSIDDTMIAERELAAESILEYIEYQMRQAAADRPEALEPNSIKGLDATYIKLQIARYLRRGSQVKDIALRRASADGLQVVVTYQYHTTQDVIIDGATIAYMNIYDLPVYIAEKLDNQPPASARRYQPEDIVAWGVLPWASPTLADIAPTPRETVKLVIEAPLDPWVPVEEGAKWLNN
jgi:hypothetical protein